MIDIKTHYNSCLYHASSALYRALTRLSEEHFRSAELSPTQGFILMTVKAAPGIIVRDLALVHQLDPTTVSRTLDKMAAKGLIKREGTGRAVRVFNTTRGMRKEADAQAAWEKLKVAYNDIVGGGEARILANGAAKAYSALTEQE
jgi:MarR family transcriptional regulator, organic hydroperoxide resistance regulator